MSHNMDVISFNSLWSGLKMGVSTGIYHLLGSRVICWLFLHALLLILECLPSSVRPFPLLFTVQEKLGRNYCKKFCSSTALLLHSYRRADRWGESIGTLVWLLNASINYTDDGMVFMKIFKEIIPSVLNVRYRKINKRKPYTNA